MEYDAEVPSCPADAKAVIVTPTLVADRFVQLTPAYDGSGQTMADGDEIELPDTAVPVELDRIYSSLRDLSEALGPNGVNKDGTLDHLLRASARGAGGRGRARQRDAPQPVGGHADDRRRQRGPLRHRRGARRRSPRRWRQNDRLVRAFIRDLAGMSGRWSPSASSSSERCPRWRARSARSKSSSRTTARRWSPTSRS